MDIHSKHYAGLTSEEPNPRTREIDTLDATGILRLINEEDKQVPAAVEKEIPHIAQVVDLLEAALRAGGRMIYVGAGTSGRLGILDASECPPTFGTPPEMVQGFIAGGDTAMRTAVEGAEDDEAAGMALMDECAVGPSDVVVGITASGTAAYVVGAATRARQRGAKTVAVVTNHGTVLAGCVDVSIEPVVGPEVIMGSTRMKSGTAQKLVLNMLTTAVMIRLGKVYRNMMVDLHASNRKLYDRSLRMIVRITGAEAAAAEAALEAAEGQVKTAVVMLQTGFGAQEARIALAANGGRLRETLAAAGREPAV